MKCVALHLFYTQLIFIMKENKELYEAPTVTAVEMKQEGVICTSGDVTATMNGVFSEETI